MSRIVFVILGVAALLGGLNAMALIYDLAVLASAHLATAIVAALFALTAALVGGVGLELSRRWRPRRPRPCRFNGPCAALRRCSRQRD